MHAVSLRAPSGRSQESLFRSLPIYPVVDELGPDHDKLFRVELTVNGKVLSKGEGKTKKAAEQAAAEVALAQLES